MKSLLKRIYLSGGITEDNIGCYSAEELEEIIKLRDDGYLQHSEGTAFDYSGKKRKCVKIHITRQAYNLIAYDPEHRKEHEKG